MKGPATLPEPVTAEGRAGLAAVLADPGRALIALDFDGTLSPIVADPAAARAHPGAAAALRRLSGRIGALAVITGRPAAVAVDLGGFRDIPGLTVLGNYGLDRWADGQLDSPPPPPGVAAARAELPGLLAALGAPDGTRTEDKGQAVVVHTRQAAEPARRAGPAPRPAHRPGGPARPDGRAGPDGAGATPARQRQRRHAAGVRCGERSRARSCIAATTWAIWPLSALCANCARLACPAWPCAAAPLRFPRSPTPQTWWWTARTGSSRCWPRWLTRSASGRRGGAAGRPERPAAVRHGAAVRR